MKKIIWKKYLKGLYHKIINDDVSALGAQLTYYLLLAIFPFLLFLITLAGYTPITGDKALSGISPYLPSYAYDVIKGIMNQIIAVKSVKLLSFGMIAALWAASNGLEAFIKGINKAYAQKESRPYWKVKLISIIYTIFLAILFVFSLIMVVFGEIIGKSLFGFFGLTNVFLVIWNTSRFIIPLVTMIIVFILLYYYAPNRRLSFKGVLPGAIISTVGWLLVSTFFSFYVNNFNSYYYMYGSIGGIIGLLIWLYWCSILVLIGGEINASLYYYREKLK